MAENEGSLAAGNVLTSQFDTPIQHDVVLWDDTLRDGEQTVGVCFSVEQKVEIAKLLLAAGVNKLCAGFPAVSDEERESVRALMKLQRPGDYFHCLCRAMSSDVDAAIASGAQNVALFIATSDLHLEKKHKFGEIEALDKLKRTIEYSLGKGLGVSVGIEDGSRTPMDRVLMFLREFAKYKLDTIVFTDTVGVLTPGATARLIPELVKVCGDIPLAAHFHNDLGMATANSIIALQAGAQGIEGSFIGLGERAGNVCFDEIAVILRVKYGLDLGIDLPKLVQAARRISEIARHPIAYSKPIVGSQVFSHESGIHVHGVLNDPATYEPFPPHMIGRKHEIRYGKHSGLNSVRYLARELGLEASPTVLEETLRRIKRETVESGAPSPAQAADMLRAVLAEQA